MVISILQRSRVEELGGDVTAGPVGGGPVRLASGGSSRRRTRVDALGGVAAQGSQAVASLALQVLAARLLGLDGLGHFGALYGVIVMATALCSGFVGDSLTVLDRWRTDVRAALQTWLLVVAAVTGVACAFAAALTDAVSLFGALAFAGAAVAFLVEDILRRLLMATMHFWRIVVIDAAAMVAAVATLVVASVASEPSLTLVLVALMAGQLVGIAVAVPLVPAHERYLVRIQAPALRAVASFGGWRALQQAIRPAVLASVRVVGLVGVSAAAVGRFEAARIYMAPSMLAVAGVGTYLFASYAARRDEPLDDLVRLADRSVVSLFCTIGAFGVVAAAGIGWLGPVLTDGKYELSLTTVIGWGAYAAAVAGVMPYAQLAAVRGRQAAVLGVRIADSALSLLAVLAIVLVTDSLRWAPVALAAGSFAGGVAIRQLLLRPGTRRETASAIPSAEPA